jgi:hypothetical protein
MTNTDPLNSHGSDDSHAGIGVEGQATEAAQPPPESQTKLGGLGPIVAPSPALGMYADVVDDLERAREDNKNRLRAMTTAVDKGGHGLDVDHPDVARLSLLVDALMAAEKQAVKELERAMKAHPLGAWVKAQHGIGEKTIARLLGCIQDPYWHDVHNRPRKLRELRKYCGVHGPDTAAQSPHDSQLDLGGGVAPSRKRGQKVDWNANARMRLWNVANPATWQRKSPYREVYDKARAKYADAIHNNPCVRCGPKGKPAQPGSDLSDGHKHARALRSVMQEILNDLWREAKRIHETTAAPSATALAIITSAPRSNHEEMQ